MWWILVAVLLVVPAAAAELKSASVAAFDRYVRETEQRLDEYKGALWADASPGRAQRLRNGEILVEPFHANPLVSVRDGLIHDWIGAAFLPGVTVEQTLALVQDYNKHKQYYRPEVVESRILSHEDDHFRVFLRLLKKQVVTVVLDTEHDIQYEHLGPKNWRSASRSTRISEVQNAGEANEKVLPAGTGQGFLWKLNSYWRFQERDGGTWIECEAISLTRDIPVGLGWLIQPIIRNLPRESLQNTLKSTVAALKH